jgi:Uma2 family endonuclease
MLVQTPPMTVEQFDPFVLLPENRERRLEFINGRVVEVVSNSYSSIVAVRFSAKITTFVYDHKLGWTTGADGGYRVAGQRLIPNIGFISIARQPEAPHETYVAQAPDLAVEVLSPSVEPHEVRLKIVNYLRAGTTIWVVDTVVRRVEIYAPDAEPRVLGEADSIDGGTMFPGFRLAVKDIFPD